MNAVARTVCYGCLALALPVGALGIGLGAAQMPILGGFALCVAGFMLVLTVGLALYDMSQTAKNDRADEEVIKRLAADGTLTTKLREAGYHAKVVKRDPT